VGAAERATRRPPLLPLPPTSGVAAFNTVLLHRRPLKICGWPPLPPICRRRPSLPPPPPSGAGGLLFLPSAAGRRAAGRHGRNGPSCRSSCLGPARHENWAPCSCCARNVAHNAGTTRHEVASCPSCSCCLVPVPPRARAVLGWAGQMATYSTSEGWNRIRRSMLTAPLPSSARSGA
jgi:hypothetical protein